MMECFASFLTPSGSSLRRSHTTRRRSKATVVCWLGANTRCGLMAVGFTKAFLPSIRKHVLALWSTRVEEVRVQQGKMFKISRVRNIHNIIIIATYTLGCVETIPAEMFVAKRTEDSATTTIALNPYTTIRALLGTRRLQISKRQGLLLFLLGDRIVVEQHSTKPISIDSVVLVVPRAILMASSLAKVDVTQSNNAQGNRKLDQVFVLGEFFDQQCCHCNFLALRFVSPVDVS